MTNVDLCDSTCRIIRYYPADTWYQYSKYIHHFKPFINTLMYRHLSTITGLFIAVLLISGIVSTKLIQIGPFAFDGGTLLFPLSYIFGDILTEVYGYRQSRKVIWTGFASMVLMSGTIILISRLPAAAERWFQSDYINILMLTPRIFLASIIAYLVGEFVNSVIVAQLKVHDRGAQLRKRLIWSTIVGQGLDTVLFVMIAFVGVYDMSVLWVIIISNYLFKIGIEIVILPITYRIIAWLKKIEQVDVYDATTDFNPFHL